MVRVFTYQATPRGRPPEAIAEDSFAASTTTPATTRPPGCPACTTSGGCAHCPSLKTAVLQQVMLRSSLLRVAGSWASAAMSLAGMPTATKPLAGLCDAARCPQATIYRQHREVWTACVTTTETFLGNPRIPAG